MKQSSAQSPLSKAKIIYVNQGETDVHQYGDSPQMKIDTLIKSVVCCQDLLNIEEGKKC